MEVGQVLLILFSPYIQMGVHWAIQVRLARGGGVIRDWYGH